MTWGEDGSLHCGNEALYGCTFLAERGSRGSTDTVARRRGWRIWGDDANCPDCSKPARRTSRTGVIEQEMLELDFGPPAAKKTGKTSKRHIS